MANDFNQALRSDGHFDTIRILRGALSRPTIRLPELIRLRCRCVRAAEALGKFLSAADFSLRAIPETMRAAVYRGKSVVNVEEIPTPAIQPREILIRVEACGICHTDLKKIEHNLLTPPRVYGHETAGVVAAVGAGVTKFRP